MSDRILALSDLRTYLNNVKDLEVMCYQQARLVCTLNRLPEITKKEISTLKEDISSLKHNIQEANDKLKTSDRIVTFIGGALVSLFYSTIGALLGGVVGLLVWLISVLVVGKAIAAFLSCILWGAAIVLILSFVMIFCFLLHEEMKDIKLAPAQIELYNKQIQEVTSLLKQKEESLKESIPNAILNAKNHYQQSLDCLNAYYDTGVIYPKYRGIVPISTIYEYIASGRCDTLTGHEGAYNLYENELHMNLIIGKLDDISNKLDEISDNQRLLVQEIRESNQRIDRLSQSVLGTLDGIEKNAELTTYYSCISASNTSYIAWLKFLDR